MQPPSGGCVLKLKIQRAICDHRVQPPSGGCVLKQSTYTYYRGLD